MSVSTLSRDYRPLIPRMVETIVEKFHPLKVILFGSYARGDFGPDSDVDFMVVLPESEIPDENAREERDLDLRGALGDFRCPKDVIITTPSELAKYSNVIGYIFRPALKEGKVVYER